MNSRLTLILSLLLMLVLTAGCTFTPEQLATIQRNVDYWATQSAAIAADAASSNVPVQATVEPSLPAETATPMPESAAPLTDTMTASETVTVTELLTGTVSSSEELTVTVTPTEEITVTVALSESVAPSEALTATVGVTESLATGEALTATVEAAPVITATATLTTTPEAPVGPGPEATSEAPTAAAVVRNQRVNVRGGPGTEFAVLTTVAQNTELEIVGSNANKSWWRVCCVNDDQKAWVSASVVTARGDLASVPVVGPLMPDDLNASWAILWECKAEGCAQEQCLGDSDAQTLRVRNSRWLEVKREATWEDDCGEPEDWLTQVDRYTGQEQRVTANAPLFYVWEGANPGEETRQLDHLERTLSLWCSDTRVREVDQGDGWSVLFEGEVCYDRASGVLVTLQYTKRWLYTGTFGGQTYDHQYFGDYEVYQQVLTETNAPLTGD